MGISTNGAIRYSNDAPTLCCDPLITNRITRSCLGSKMLPTIALQHDSEIGQCKVNAVPSDFLFEDVADSEVDQDVFSHRFDVGAIPGLSLPSGVSGFVPAIHSVKRSATVRAKLLTLRYAMSFERASVSALGANNRCPSRCISARIGAESSDRLTSGVRRERCAAVFTDRRDHPLRTAGHRAIRVLVRFARANLKGFAALRARLGNTILAATVRTESTTNTCTSLIAYAASFAGVPRIRRYEVLGAFWPSHASYFTSNLGRVS